MNPTIVIGAGEDARIPALVCEHTIRKYCPEARIIHTYNRPDRPTRGLKQEGGKDPTKFSFVRFWVPQLCEYKGRGIYLDSDMILFADIQELFDTPMDGKAILRTSDPSVLLFDCEKVDWDAHEIVRVVDSGKMKYGTNMLTLHGTDPKLVGRLDDVWNHRDNYHPGKTKLLHYTNMRTQPWPNHLHDKPARHRHAELWNTALCETLRSGMLTLAELPDCLNEMEVKTGDTPQSQEA